MTEHLPCFAVRCTAESAFGFEEISFGAEILFKIFDLFGGNREKQLENTLNEILAGEQVGGGRVYKRRPSIQYFD